MRRCWATSNGRVCSSLWTFWQKTLEALEKDNPQPALESFEVELTGIYKRVSAIQKQPEVWIKTLAWLSGEGWEKVSRRLLELLENNPNLNSESLSELQLYLDLMHHQLQDMQRSLDLFAPWLGLLETAPAELTETSAWQELQNSLPAALPTLGQAEAIYDRIKTALDHCKAQLQDGVIPVPGRDERIPVPAQAEAALAWYKKLDDRLSSAQMTVIPLLIGFRDLAGQANAAVSAMDFRFLFDEHRQVFHIGYNVNTEQLDPSYYDLLASEARIASLIAIAKGDAPQSHWQHLGRPVTKVNGKQVLLSWNGTMFEYLMPALFAKTTPGRFSRTVATRPWRHRRVTDRNCKCPGASPNQAIMPSMSI